MLIAAARRLGDPSTFGLEEMSGPGIYVDPGVYAESVLRVAADTLNKVMAGTGVELLVDDRNVLLTGLPNFPKGDAMAASNTIWARVTCQYGNYTSAPTTSAHRAPHRSTRPDRDCVWASEPPHQRDRMPQTLGPGSDANTCGYL